MMHWWYGGMGVWGYLLMAAGMAVFLGVLVLLAVAVAAAVSRNQRHAGGPMTVHQTAEEILAERFARGEIGRQEYEDDLAALAGSAAINPRDAADGRGDRRSGAE